MAEPKSESRFEQLVDAEAGTRAVVQGNLAFALGCVRGGLHAADGYPGTPSTEVIDKGLALVQGRMTVGWSVNEAHAVGVGFGETMAGADVVVTMKIPGLFQAADVVSTVAQVTAKRGALVFYIATDFVPSSTQHVVDPRYFLKSCNIPVLEPRTHQEMLEAPAEAALLGRRFGTPVAVLPSGLLCHSDGLVRLDPARVVPRLDVGDDFTRFMNLPDIARRNHELICSERLPGLRAFAEASPQNRIEWHDRSLGVVVHGITDTFLREAWPHLPVKPSVLSLGLTYPLPRDLVTQFVSGVDGRVVVLSDGMRFVQEELLAQGYRVEGKAELDSRTEWSPDAVARSLGAEATAKASVTVPAALRRPPTICAGCSYRAFGLAVQRLRKRRAIVASFGDIGCNTLLYFLRAVDTCTCMGGSDTQRQGVVLMEPRLAGKVISVIGDSTECHSGLDATRNAVFRNIPGVKVVLDNRITAMTGGQPAPTSRTNLAGETPRFDLERALAAEGARVDLVDAFDFKGIEAALKAALARAEAGELSVLVVRGSCMQEASGRPRRPSLEVDRDKCVRCDLCLVCPGVERGDDGFPRFTHLCSSCGGQAPVCAQLCNRAALVPAHESPDAAAPPTAPPSPDADDDAPVTALPPALRLAVRGVGGQGNLFLGNVLVELALDLGFPHIVKGETHGMAQLGGAVVSTFACGDVHSPVLAAGSADVIVVLEMSEVLRPGFLELLRPGGTVILNRLRVLPEGVNASEYPPLEALREVLRGHKVVELDALAEARAIGDTTGRTANVIALGVLSTVPPFAAIPVSRWRRAIRAVTRGDAAREANLSAFLRGRAAAPT